MKIEQLLTSDFSAFRELGRQLLEKKLPISLTDYYGPAAYFTLTDGSEQFALISPIGKEGWMCGGKSVSKLDPDKLLTQLRRDNDSITCHNHRTDHYMIKMVEQVIRLFEIIIENSSLKHHITKH